MTASDSMDYVNAHSNGEAVAIVAAYPVRGLNRDSEAVSAFFKEAQARLVPGMAMMGGPGPRANGDRVVLVGFTFTIDHIPLPMEEVIEWLREHPLVRVIEIDRFGVASAPPAT